MGHQWLICGAVPTSTRIPFLNEEMKQEGAGPFRQFSVKLERRRLLHKERRRESEHKRADLPHLCLVWS
jgi:hypothetical protein